MCITHFTHFFFHSTSPTEIYTLSLHDALPIYRHGSSSGTSSCPLRRSRGALSSHSVRGHSLVTAPSPPSPPSSRSEEHTSELQSRRDLVCRLLLEKKKQNI